MGRPFRQIEISKSDREELSRLCRSGTTPQRLVDRTRIVLLFGEGKLAQEVAELTGFSYNTVCRWGRRFEESGLDGLDDKPRTGQPKKLTAAKAKAVLKLTVEQIPHESTHWSLRLMAKYSGVGIHHIRKIWKAADLKPHRLKNFKISNDPEFAEKVQDVVGLYLHPPDNAMVLSVDEKTQIQALDRTQPMLPMRPGQIERRTHDYKRNGTRSLYAAFDIATGKVLGRVTRRHRAKEFIAFLNQIKLSVPEHVEVHLILDNSSTHKTPEVKNWMKRNPRFFFHFTPTSASWLNAVESWFSQLERRSLYRGVFTNVTELRDEIHRFISAHNERFAKPFIWTKTANLIIKKHGNAKAVVIDGN